MDLAQHWAVVTGEILSRSRVLHDSRRRVVQFSVIVGAESCSHWSSKGLLCGLLGVGARPEVLSCIRLDLIQLDGTDAGLVWEKLAHLVEGNDFLIFHESLSFRLLHFLDVFNFFVLSGADIRNTSA